MPTQDIRYSRQISLAGVGESGQKRLADSQVLLIGAGGLGTPAGLYLASSGVGHLVINDFDTIDASNLPRQILYRDTDNGQHKASVAANRLNEINPEIEAVPIQKKLDSDALATHINSSDVVLDCTDNFASRWLINELCAQQKTALVSGAAIRMEGQLSVFRHDLATPPCYRCLYREEDENLDNCAGQGILAPVAGTIGCMMATETIKLLLGQTSQLHGHLWVYDAGSGASRMLKIAARPDCPVCGTPGN